VNIRRLRPVASVASIWCCDDSDGRVTVAVEL